MIDLHPQMSPQLLSDVEDFYTNDECIISADSILVRYWDEVSAAVLAASEKLGLPPRVIIEEFCYPTDFPEIPEML